MCDRDLLEETTTTHRTLRSDLQALSLMHVGCTPRLVLEGLPPSSICARPPVPFRCVAAISFKRPRPHIRCGPSATRFAQHHTSREEYKVAFSLREHQHEQRRRSRDHARAPCMLPARGAPRVRAAPTPEPRSPIFTGKLWYRQLLEIAQVACASVTESIMGNETCRSSVRCTTISAPNQVLYTPCPNSPRTGVGARLNQPRHAKPC